MEEGKGWLWEVGTQVGLRAVHDVNDHISLFQKTSVNPCLRVDRFCNFAIKVWTSSRSRPIQPLGWSFFPSH